MNAIGRFFRSCKTIGIGPNIIHLFALVIWKVQKRKFLYVGKNSFIEYPFIIRGANKIKLGENFRAKKRLQMEAIIEHNEHFFSPEITIGNNVSINYDVHIAASNKIVIEDGVLIASKVFITDHFHGTTQYEDIIIPPQKRVLYSKGPVIIRENTWIGEGVAIMPGVTIGKNSVIGANSVVTKDIPDFSIVAGVPATIIKSYGGKFNVGKS